MKVMATEVRATHIADRPPAGERCQHCGADCRSYRKNKPEPDGPYKGKCLIGGHCGKCHRVWLPPITFGKPRQIEVELTITED
jgi:hypothetical protein